jgi:hypothetical protein
MGQLKILTNFENFFGMTSPLKSFLGHLECIWLWLGQNDDDIGGPLVPTGNMAQD